MMKGKLKYLLIVVTTVFIVSPFLFSFDEDSEVSIGTHNDGRRVRGSVLSLVLFDKSSHKYTKLKDKNVVKSGQRFTISVINSESGYIYVLNINTENILHATYPNKKMPQRRFSKSNGLVLPISEKGKTAIFEFDNKKGKEIYYIFVGFNRIEPLEKLMKKIPEDGLKLSEKTNITKRLHKLYQRGKKNILSKRPKRFMDKSSVWNVFFRYYYAKKYVFDHQ